MLWRPAAVDSAAQTEEGKGRTPGLLMEHLFVRTAYSQSPQIPLSWNSTWM